MYLRKKTGTQIYYGAAFFFVLPGNFCTERCLPVFAMLSEQLPRYPTVPSRALVPCCVVAPQRNILVEVAVFRNALAEGDVRAACLNTFAFWRHNFPPPQEACLLRRLFRRVWGRGGHRPCFVFAAADEKYF